MKKSEVTRRNSVKASTANRRRMVRSGNNKIEEITIEDLKRVPIETEIISVKLP